MEMLDGIKFLYNSEKLKESGQKVEEAESEDVITWPHLCFEPGAEIVNKNYSPYKIKWYKHPEPSKVIEFEDFIEMDQEQGNDKSKLFPNDDDNFRHFNTVRSEWLVTKRKLKSSDEKLNWTDSKQHLKCKMSSEIPKSSVNPYLEGSFYEKQRWLGSSCEENRIYLTTLEPSNAQTIVTESDAKRPMVSATFFERDFKLENCSYDMLKHYEWRKKIKSPIYGLDTIYGNIEDRLTGKSEYRPVVWFNPDYLKEYEEAYGTLAFEKFRFKL